MAPSLKNKIIRKSGVEEKWRGKGRREEGRREKGGKERKVGGLAELGRKKQCEWEQQASK